MYATDAITPPLDDAGPRGTAARPGVGIVVAGVGAHTAQPPPAPRRGPDRSRRASWCRSSAPAAPARRPCSTPSPASARRRPAPSPSTGSTSPAPVTATSSATCRRTTSSTATCRWPRRCATPPGCACRPAPPPGEIDRIVARTLDELDLADRASVRVGDLSGGQRKRVSIAVELLTRPRSLFLDEPTSGLDPATAANLMATLRRLADRGTTVVLTTHNPEDLPASDRIVVVARRTDRRRRQPRRGAAPASPSIASPTSTCASPPSAPPAATTTSRPPTPAVRSPGRSGSPPPARGHHELVRAVASADRAQPRHPAPQPPHAGDHARRAGPRDRHVHDAVPAGRARPPDAPTRRRRSARPTGWRSPPSSSGSPTACCRSAPRSRSCAGRRSSASASAPTWRPRSPCSPRCSPSSTSPCSPSSAALDRLPTHVGARPSAASRVTLVLTSLAALALGLLASAAVADPTQATLALPMLCFPAVLFAGAVLPVDTMNVGGRALSVVEIARWAFEAIGHDLGLSVAARPRSLGRWRCAAGPARVGVRPRHHHALAVARALRRRLHGRHRRRPAAAHRALIAALDRSTVSAGVRRPGRAGRRCRPRSRPR